MRRQIHHALDQVADQHRSERQPHGAQRALVESEALRQCFRNPGAPLEVPKPAAAFAHRRSAAASSTQMRG
jgi:hypothetical protein